MCEEYEETILWTWVWVEHPKHKLRFLLCEVDFDKENFVGRLEAIIRIHYLVIVSRNNIAN